LKRWLAMLAGVAIAVLPGCDAVFRLSTVDPPGDAAAVTVDAPIAIGWKSIAAGYLHTCGIRADDTLWCWGSNELSELGVGLPQGIVEAPQRVGTKLYRSVSTTLQHTCAIAVDDTLWCWGANEHGQLGTGNLTTGQVPLQIDGAWKLVATGGWQTCGIKTDDTLWCWGWNYWGELGLGTNTQTPSPAQVGAETWLDIEPGFYQTCGIHSDHSLWCWGDNSAGSTGDGTFAGSVVPVPGPVGAWTRVDVGVHFACGIQMTGEMRCWGSGARGARGDGASSGSVATPQVVSIDDKDVADWTQLSVDHQHACATRVDGSLWCWGTNGRSQLGFPGIGAVAARPVQRTLPSATWRRVDTGVVHTCAIDLDSELWCNGGSGRGQLANGATSHPRPVKMPATLGLLRLGSNTTCGLDPNGRISCSGANSGGQLGDGTKELRKSLVPMAANLGQIGVVAPGTAHSCALSGTATMCWGANYYGQLGNGTATESLTPVVAGGALPLLASRNHTCGIDAATNLYCWGLNNYGQVGNATYVNQTTPALVGAGNSVTVGAYHTCVTTSNGSLSAYCWGRNSEGQVGNGTFVTVSAPVSVNQSVSGQLVQISAGGEHTCAIAATGRLWCWGDNTSGQLGLGDGVPRGAPAVVGVQAWARVASGLGHTCGVQKSGTLWCWGRGHRGQLGIGSYTDRFVPVQVGSDSDWVTVDAGDDHTCATKAGNEVWCWGANDAGELPDGTSWDDVPVRVP
jgi:alpha-tubulin suppressor-like RCC1 family protein